MISLIDGKTVYEDIFITITLFFIVGIFAYIMSNISTISLGSFFGPRDCPLLAPLPSRANYFTQTIAALEFFN